MSPVGSDQAEVKYDNFLERCLQPSAINFCSSCAFIQATAWAREHAKQGCIATGETPAGLATLCGGGAFSCVQGGYWLMMANAVFLLATKSTCTLMSAGCLSGSAVGPVQLLCTYTARASPHPQVREGFRILGAKPKFTGYLPHMNMGRCTISSEPLLVFLQETCKPGFGSLADALIIQRSR